MNTKTFLKKVFLIGGISLLTHSTTFTMITTKNPSPSDGITINGLVGKFPFALEKFINRILEIKNSIKTQQTNLKKCSKFLFYGDPGNGKRSAAQIIAQKEGVELVDISGKFLHSSSPEDAICELERSFDEAAIIAERDQIVVLMIDDIGLIANNKNLKSTFWQKMDAIKNDPRFIVIGIENYTLLETFLKDKLNAITIKFENPDPYTLREILYFYWQASLGKLSENERGLINRISSKCFSLPAQALKDIIEEAITNARKHGLSKPNEKNFLDAINSIKKRDYRHLPKQRGETLKKVGGVIKDYILPMVIIILEKVGKKDSSSNNFY